MAACRRWSKPWTLVRAGRRGGRLVLLCRSTAGPPCQQEPQGARCCPAPAPAQDGVARLPETSVTDKCETYRHRGYATKSFRLMAVAADGSTLPAVSNKFAVRARPAPPPSPLLPPEPLCMLCLNATRFTMPPPGANFLGGAPGRSRHCMPATATSPHPHPHPRRSRRRVP
jgi:hypothetical protein